MNQLNVAIMGCFVGAKHEQTLGKNYHMCRAGKIIWMWTSSIIGNSKLVMDDIVRDVLLWSSPSLATDRRTHQCHIRANVANSVLPRRCP